MREQGKLVDAFDRGIPIIARGGHYLAFATLYNAAGGRRGGWNCTMHRPLENRQMLSMEVVPRVDRGNVTETTTRIWERNPR